MPSHKKLYLAGPITGLSYDTARGGWRKEFAEMLRLQSPHIECYSPMRAKEFLSEQQSLQCRGEDLEKLGHALSRPLGILTRDGNDVRTADAIVACFLDHAAGVASLGTVWEIGYAAASRVPVVAVMKPGGPVRYPSDIDSAWMAGFFEGDGCVHMRATGKSNYHQVYVVFHVNDKCLLDRVVRILGFGNVYASAKTSKGTQTWRLALTGDHARVALGAMYPWLIRKKARAAIALEMLDAQRVRHIGGRHWRPRTEEETRIETIIAERYAATFKSESVAYDEPIIPRDDIHQHIFITHSAGYVVDTLEEAAIIVGSLLTPDV
jgi:nucleoside 2-deoxyribosyltransferase